jgi:4'-phosphopantetheinyl transferase
VAQTCFWQPGPAQPRLAVGLADVWIADLADAAARVRAAEPLAADERERAERFARPGDGERWGAARGVLRALLGAYTGADPRALRFAEGPHGKPGLAAGDGHGSVGAAAAPSRLRFNLSHSADTALVALALDREVGIDVELPRRAVDHVAIARRILGDAQAERLQALDPPRREHEFLRAWVRWEAILKCRGTGIGGAGATHDGPEPWVHELEIAPPGAAALAAEGGPLAVRRWSWPPAVA